MAEIASQSLKGNTERRNFQKFKIHEHPPDTFRISNARLVTQAGLNKNIEDNRLSI
jgi:hypothetical protein